MGSKKHKKHHKSEKKDAGSEDRSEKPLKLVLKVGSSSSSVQAPTPPAPVLSPISQTPISAEQPKPPQLDEHLPDRKSEVGGGHFHEKHKKSKKKKKKKSSEREKERHDRKRKHHHHHHHHREHSHERKEKRKRDHDIIHSDVGSRSLGSEPPQKRPIVEEVAPCERPLRDPRTCTLKKKPLKTPLQLLLYYLLKKLQMKDPKEYFAWPVSDVIAPGYSSIISNPMDFSTMRKKIDDREYTSISMFKCDLKLMCDNAMTYNRSDTVYYKAAKRMWHVGQKLLSKLNCGWSDVKKTQQFLRSAISLQRHEAHLDVLHQCRRRKLTPKNVKDQLMSLRRNLIYMLELTSDELGFDVRDETEETLADEEIVMDSISFISPETKKSKSKSSWNQTQNEPDSQDDDMTPEQILMQARKAAKAAADRLTLCKPDSKFGFLRQHDNGSTTLAILNPKPYSRKGDKNGSKEMKVNLEMLTGKLTQGTGAIAGFREDPKNIVKPVNYLNYGAYSTYAPHYDSMFSNITKEESDLVLSTYGDELGVQYAESITNFAKDCDYVMNMVDNLLDILTGGEHSKTVKIVDERRKIREEEEQLKQLEMKALAAEQKLKGQQSGSTEEVDLNPLHTLSAIDLDISLLDPVDGDEPTRKQLSRSDAECRTVHSQQEDSCLLEQRSLIQEKLDKTTELLQDLAKAQHERLSSNPPTHLGHIQGPSAIEHELAEKVSKKLTEITSQVSPESVVSVESIRKAMGITFHPVSTAEDLDANSSASGSPQDKLEVSRIGATGSSGGGGDLGNDSQETRGLASCSPAQLTGDDQLPSSDLDSELREFLETGPMLRVCESPSAT